MSEENKEVKVILLKQDDEEEKKKRKKRFLLLLVGMFVIVADISGLLAFITIKDAANKNNNKEQPYVVKEETKVLYNNLLSYFNVVGEGLHPKPNKLVSVTFKDNRLYMVGVNSTNAIVVNRLTDKDNIEGALVLFSNSVPPIGDSSIESSYTLDLNSELNINSNEKIGYTYTSLTDQKFISGTYRYSGEYLYSIPHQSYSESGLYNEINKASIKDNPSVYDLFYYLINK